MAISDAKIKAETENQPFLSSPMQNKAALPAACNIIPRGESVLENKRIETFLFSIMKLGKQNFTAKFKIAVRSGV